ncbi:MAG: tyrosine recombinase XerC [Clostridia bacterium]|nr:tyrosine recombinase XerC [Clostridia bacterium]
MFDNKLPKLLRDYLNYSSNLNKSSNTIKEYQYDLVNFLKYMKLQSLNNRKMTIDDIETITDIDSKFLNNVDINDLYEYMTYLKDKCNDSAVTRARKVASLRGFFKYLHVKARVIDDNPAKELESPKLGKRLPKFLTLEQSTSLLNGVKNAPLTGKQHDNRIRDYAIITLFLNCGMRLAELVGIDITHIKFDEALLTVVGKGNKERTIYLNKAALSAIKEYLEVRPTDGVIDKNALFLSERKTRISRRTVQNLIKNYLRNICGLTEHYSTHKLRHTAATLMYQYGNVDIRALQEILGHESIATTEIYTHVDNSQIREAVENNPLANYNPKEK